MSNDRISSNISRRAMLKVGGTALVAVWSLPVLPAVAAQQSPGIASPEKPILLAPGDATDVAIHSRVENLFWCDVMMEHAAFFATLMPGTELATVRAQAESFQRGFQSQYEKAKTIAFDRTNYAAFNRSTGELIKPFIEYKQRMRDAQEAGKIRTLVFPLFFDHAAREAERADLRLQKLASGNATLEFTEVVDFWSTDTSEHADLVAHLLDPQEQDLISQALDSSALFKGFKNANRERRVPGGEIVLATEELIDFQTIVQDGVNSNRIKSILQPALVDHMRRETLKFVDELKRTGSKT
jgi:hypothetical protein